MALSSWRCIVRNRTSAEKILPVSKWKSVIGSTAKEHNKVCRLLVPFVSQGLSVPELYTHREFLSSDLRDVD